MRRIEDVLKALINGMSNCEYADAEWCKTNCAYHECCDISSGHSMAEMPRELFADAARLLLTHPMVYCISCKHADPYRMTHGSTYCQQWDRVVPLDGYCQEGKRIDGGAHSEQRNI